MRRHSNGGRPREIGSECVRGARAWPLAQGGASILATAVAMFAAGGAPLAAQLVVPDASRPELQDTVPTPLHGLNFGPFVTMDDPNFGATVTAGQLEVLMERVAPFTDWVRTFGTSQGLELVPAIARQHGKLVAVGASIGPDPQQNQVEITTLIQLAQQGDADLLIVGSEVLLRELQAPGTGLPLPELLALIAQVKAAVPDVPVTTADIYPFWLEQPALVDAVDVLFVNFYGYWEGIDVTRAVAWLDCRYEQVLEVADGKPVVVSETGWPSGGGDVTDAVASPENAAFYFRNVAAWARDRDVDVFHFEAFDEPWKVTHEGAQGAFWGVWEETATLKPGMAAAFHGVHEPDAPALLEGPGTPEIELTFVPRVGNTDDWLEGIVTHVEPCDVAVALYIEVGGAWWTKPTFAEPLVEIGCDGAWAADIVTGPGDEFATRVAAFLLPAGIEPEQAAGAGAIPASAFADAVAWVIVEKD